MHFSITFIRTLTLLLYLYFCNNVIQIFCLFYTNHFCIFRVIALYIWMLHLQCSAHLPVYCRHFQGWEAKEVSYQQVRILVGTTIWKELPPALCHLITKLSFRLLLINILLKSYIPRLLLLFMCRESVCDQCHCSLYAVICDYNNESYCQTHLVFCFILF